MNFEQWEHNLWQTSLRVSQHSQVHLASYMVALVISPLYTQETVIKNMQTFTLKVRKKKYCNIILGAAVILYTAPHSKAQK